MSARATLRQADVRRQARGLLQAARDVGLPVDGFKIMVEGGVVTLLPLAANSPSDPYAESAKRIREAFGGT